MIAVTTVPIADMTEKTMAMAPHTLPIPCAFPIARVSAFCVVSL